MPDLSDSMKIDRNKGLLSEKQIDEMREEAEEEEDKQKAKDQRIKAINSLAEFVAKLEKQVGYSSTISEENKKEAVELFAKVQNWISLNQETATIADITERHDYLKKKWAEYSAIPSIF
eukprot:TRINITY_DN880_c0_g1_i1.p1 TRINITY_DN880_c0_g1~~TRINITY_DN880_c0_g1_i1.p1  ORF type:complete len:119 (+),score=21.60 TRINITY_DN880_c0_g1_i1:183-539(+)